jgi:hypothetical protein
VINPAFRNHARIEVVDVNQADITNPVHVAVAAGSTTTARTSEIETHDFRPRMPPGPVYVRRFGPDPASCTPTGPDIGVGSSDRSEWVGEERGAREFGLLRSGAFHSEARPLRGAECLLNRCDFIAQERHCSIEARRKAI